jgi:N-acetylglucosamine kinase-like BadF-type ATPase
MLKVAVQLDQKQIESAFRQLDRREKWRLAQEVITERFLETIRKCRALARKKGWTSKQIQRMVEDAREEFHAKSRR